MQKCRIHHTGIAESASGVIKDDLVYLLGEDDKLYFPEEMYLARYECQFGLIQFEVEGKWGFADIYTGEIRIEAIWDYAGPFYGGYAHVAVGTQLEYLDYAHNNLIMHGGKHGYIDKNVKIIIPLEYDAADDIPNYPYNNFEVAKNQKWGMIDKQNRIIIPLEWDRFDINYNDDLIFVSIEEACELHVGPLDLLTSVLFRIEAEPTCYSRTKWGVYDKNGNMIIKPELDEIPVCHKIKNDSIRNTAAHRYYILKRRRRYGVLCENGKLINDIVLFKKGAIAMINELSRLELQ